MGNTQNQILQDYRPFNQRGALEQQDAQENQTATIGLQVHLIEGSLTVMRQESIFSLGFCFSAETSCTVSIIVMPQDKMLNQNFKMMRFDDYQSKLSILTCEYPSGFNQQTDPNDFVFELQQEDIEFIIKNQSYFPILIYLVIFTQCPNNCENPFNQLNYCKFSFGDQPSYRIAHQIIYNKTQSYWLMPIYGKFQEGDECSICLTNEKTCCLLPCSHICLCYQCANTMRQTVNSRCPICRTTIKDILMLEINL